MENEIQSNVPDRDKALKAINSVISTGYFAMAVSVVMAIVFFLNKRGMISAPGVPGGGTAMALFVAGYASSVGFKAVLDLLGIKQVPKQ
jgi:hypothetical protein